MQKQITVSSHVPAASFFARAKQRLFAESARRAPAVPALARSPGTAGLLTRELQAMAAPQEPPPVMRQPHHAAAVQGASQAGRFALEDTAELVAFATGQAPCAANRLAQCRAELTHRGLTIEETPAASPRGKAAVRVYCSREAFDAMSPNARSEYMRSGGSLRDGTAYLRHKNETPTAVSSRRRVKFPVQPREGDSWRQFMAYSQEAVAALAVKTSNRETGELARRHVFDAFSSLAASSWRFEGAQGFAAAWGGGGFDYNAARLSFREKFKESLGHCNKFGLYEETPNDPAPPIDPAALTAADFLRLPPPAVEKLKRAMAGGATGRNSRAELKRAFELASDAMQMALLTVWEMEIFGRFPEEWVWPPA